MTTAQPVLFTTKRFYLCLLLITMLCAVYLVSYSARIQSGDSLRLFDAGSSLARYGDFYLDESFWFQPPTTADIQSPYPLAETASTPEIITGRLIALVYQFADNFSEIGYVHAVWLINILTTALTAGMLFWYVLLRGYSEPVALLTAGLFSTGTLVWAYSKTLFREPIVMLLLLIAAFCFERWRSHGDLKLRTITACLLPGCLAFWLAFQFKESAIFALPALIILVLPFQQLTAFRNFRHANHTLLLIALGIPLVLVFIAPVLNLFLDVMYPLLQRAGVSNTQYIQTALHTYLFSIGGSFWGTSPVLLLALPGAFWLWRERRYQDVWLTVLILSGYAFGHALLTEQHWFGGLSWSPRFLLPVLPFVMLLVAPVLAKLKAQRWLIPVLIGLMLYALWIQFTAIALPWTHYSSILPPEAGLLNEWSPGLNSIQYLRWVMLWGEWEHLGLDFAWTRAGIDTWLWVFIALAMIGAIAAFFVVIRTKLSRFLVAGLWLYEIAFLMLLFFGLRDLYWHDSLYNQKAALHEAVATLEQQAIPGDILLLADDTYAEFMMNQYRLHYPRPIILPPQPGERPDSDEEPEVRSHNPPDLLTIPTIQTLDHLSSTQERIWLLAHTGDFHAWSIRPVERLFVERHYILREYPTGDPTVRLMLFDLSPAPQLTAFRHLAQPAAIRFGDSIKLTSFELPDGTRYEPGTPVPITFSWEPDAPVTENYRVAWFIAREDAAALPVQGIDSAPAAGFKPFAAIEPGIPVWDNRAIMLPETLPSGDYQIWLKLYWQDDTGLQELPVTAAKVLQETIAVLPVSLEIIDKN